MPSAPRPRNPLREPSRLSRLFRERWKIVAAIFFVVFALAALVTVLTPKVYKASAQILVVSNAPADSQNQLQTALFVQAQVITFAEIVRSPDVLNACACGPQPAGRNRPAVEDRRGGPARYDDHRCDRRGPFRAARRRDRSVRRARLPGGDPELHDLHGVRELEAGPDGPPADHRPGAGAGEPIAPRPLLNLVLGAIIGLLLGLSAAVLREVLDNRIKSPEQLAKLVGIPGMGLIVEDPRAAKTPVAVRAGERNPRGENFRQLRANLQFANVDAHPRIIAVTSSIPSEGKTSVAVNLAATLAEVGFTVCLVDADLRRPTVAKVLGCPPPWG